MLDENTHWACVGPNGAGKTSLARVLCGQAKHASGSIQRSEVLDTDGVAYVCFEQAKALCDRDKKLDDSEFQASAQDSGTSVEQAILGKRQADADFTYWVDRLAMNHILTRGLRYISTGEMRKTLLLKAILSRPGLLILDSPLDGLDKQSQSEMRTIIDELLTGDRPVLILCRQLADVPRRCTHLMVLERGEVLAAGERAATIARSDVSALMEPVLPSMGTLPGLAQRPYNLPKDGPLLQLKNVSVDYGDLNVLRNVDWTFARGQHCCIAGPNGCGKTTLLSLVTGDNHKAYGQDITLFGIPRGSGESIWDIKQKFGQIDTQLHLNFARGMRVIEVVVSGFFDSIGLYDDWGDKQRETATAWLRALGISDLERTGFDTLSFGMQRMVLLARAMVKAPTILVLDEPTLGLDGYHRRLILQAIDHIARQSDTQILFVSHSSGDMPACINQLLTFEPNEQGFEVVCQDLAQ